MSVEYEKRLEREIHRELNKLPELLAPPTVVSRVMRAIEQRFSLPWYQQSWQLWPLALRGVSLVILLALFGGLCFGAWKLTHVETVTATMQRPLGWLAGLGDILHIVSVVLTSIIFKIKQLGTGILVACLAALAFGYAMCVGLGTVYLRLGLVRR